jgi:hypothetical protein
MKRQNDIPAASAEEAPPKKITRLDCDAEGDGVLLLFCFMLLDFDKPFLEDKVDEVDSTENDVKEMDACIETARKKVSQSKEFLGLLDHEVVYLVQLYFSYRL